MSNQPFDQKTSTKSRYAWFQLIICWFKMLKAESIYSYLHTNHIPSHQEVTRIGWCFCWFHFCWFQHVSKFIHPSCKTSSWMEHFPCALHGNGDGSPQELQDAQLLPPNSADFLGMKTFAFKSILVGARANLPWDQDISGSYHGANFQHHVDTDRTPFILEMTQIWSI